VGVRKDIENVSNSSEVEARSLGARSLKKVKAARRAGWTLWWKGCRKPHNRRRFLPPFQTGLVFTQTKPRS
jgi:hypothetical protein